ncbi:MAG TPA: hypothetical protein PLQ81_14295, partial [bacterium]|nr:hypothetical protein [bacterium]
NYVYDIIKYKEFYYASTGPNGRIYRIGISGQPELFYKIKDNDCLALGVYGDKILAGGSSSGNLYSIPVDDTVSAEIIEDFGEAEIKKIIVGNNKIFAAVNTIMGGNRFQQNEPVQEEIMDEETAIEFFGEITEEYIENSGQTQEEIISKIKNKNSNQTAIKKNNYKNGLIFEIEETRKTIAAELKNDFIVNFDIVKNGDIYAVSGKKNSALKINKKDYSIVFVNKSGKIQNINFDESGKPLLITVSNPSRILTADNSKKEFEYVSEIIDMENKSELGVPEIEHGGKIEYSYRTGNSSKINDLWSVWKTGRLNSAARYFQFKIRFLSADSFLKKITIPYIQLNLKPALKYANINPSFPKSRNSKSKQTISRQMQGVQINQPQNPVSEAMMIEAAQNFQEQQQMQPNMQLGTAEPTYNIRWSASDPNNDKLSHNIYYRYETGEWIKIKFDKHYTRNSYTWKTSYFPDGK